MHWIAWHGYTEIFKFLALLTDNPNPPDNIGRTPYIVARVRRSKEIQKFLQTYETSRKRKTGFSLTKPSKKRALLHIFISLIQFANCVLFQTYI